jgi:DNA-binding transcriptional MerR regulator
MKRAGGRRYYRPDDVDLLRGIRHLLYGEGYTIRGVQRILREQGPRFVQTVWRPGALQPSLEEEVEDETVDQTDVGASEVKANALPDRANLSEKENEDEDQDRDEDENEEADANDELDTESEPQQPRLSDVDIQRLQSALDDLREARNMIDLALKVHGA